MRSDIGTLSPTTQSIASSFGSDRLVTYASPTIREFNVGPHLYLWSGRLLRDQGYGIVTSTGGDEGLLSDTLPLFDLAASAVAT